MSHTVLHGPGSCKPVGVPQPTELGPPFFEVSHH